MLGPVENLIERCVPPQRVADDGTLPRKGTQRVMQSLASMSYAGL